MAIGTVASAQVAPTRPVSGHGFAGNLKVAYGTYNIASAVAQNDVIQMCRTPKGAIILDVQIFGQDIDTGTEALDFDAGYAANGVDAADTDAWGVFVNVTGDGIGNDTASVRLFAAGVLASGGPKQLSAETVHQIIFNAAANAGGTGRLNMLVYYIVP
jgi:hypothetical protein